MNALQGMYRYSKELFKCVHIKCVHIKNFINLYNSCKNSERKTLVGMGGKWPFYEVWRRAALDSKQVVTHYLLPDLGSEHFPAS